MRQCDPLAQQRGNYRLALYDRRIKVITHVAFALKLAAHFLEQLRLSQRLVHHHKMVGVEKLLQHIGLGAIHQHQLTQLF
ncbi:hypothetical protein D3C72_1308660 [compost metagenome]